MRTHLLLIPSLLMVCVTLWACGAERPPEYVNLTGKCMGTEWNAVVEVPSGMGPKSALDLIQEELDSVDRAMSTWKPESDLSRFNRAGAGEPVEVSSLTLSVLELAAPLVSNTDGVFDPTVGPLVRLWGFGSYGTQDAAPTDPEVAAALSQLGFAELRWNGATLTKERGDIELDLSAIAKGHAADLAAQSLLAAGVRSFLLEVGGEMVLHGENATGEAWRVGVDDPLPPEGSEPHSPLNLGPRRPFARLSLSGLAVATSGDYRNVREIDGRIVAHAIDPRTGRPIDHDLASVTVIAPTCAVADALATAALVLGPIEGLALLESQPGIEGYMLVRTGNEAAPLSTVMTTGMEPFLMAPIPR